MLWVHVLPVMLHLRVVLRRHVWLGVPKRRAVPALHVLWVRALLEMLNVRRRARLTRHLPVVQAWRRYRPIRRLWLEATTTAGGWREVATHVGHVLVAHVVLHRLRGLASLVHRRHAWIQWDTRHLALACLRDVSV